MKAASQERDLIIDITENKQVKVHLEHDSLKIMNNSQIVSISSTAAQRIMVVGRKGESGGKGKKEEKEKRKMEREEEIEEEEKKEKEEKKKEKGDKKKDKKEGKEEGKKEKRKR